MTLILISTTMPRLSSKAGQKASRGSPCLIDRHHQPIPQASRVFFISELLETIFLNLDMQTLLLSRRVCRTWNEVIRTSRKLQQALFYIPDPTIPAEQGRHNPLLIDKLWFNFPGAPMGMRDGMHLAVYEVYRDSLFMPRTPRNRGREEAYRRPEASWRRMLLRQPPTSRVFFWDPETSYRDAGEVSEQ
ncbi:F-box protein, partial [Aspergillus aculeatinus CBS 121060]